MFTVGMATHQDFDGVLFTAMSLLAHHGEHVGEVVVVDNDPGNNPTATALQRFCKNHPRVRYVAYDGLKGTAAPRDHVFRIAQYDQVVCVDSHVLLLPGALAALDAFYEAHPDRRDHLVHGPLVMDNLDHHSTHFNDHWGVDLLPDGRKVYSGMWGQWATDPRVVTEPWFEIPAQGLGLFAASKKGWLGFNPRFRGFGGEEWYIHEKYRKAGRKVWCVSDLRWWHRFARPAGITYPLSNHDKCRNYIIGHAELGLPFDRVHEHFVGGGLVGQGDWDKFVNEPVSKGGCGCGGAKSPAVTPIPPPPRPAGPGVAAVTPAPSSVAYDSIATWVAGATYMWPGAEHLPTLTNYARSHPGVVLLTGTLTDAAAALVPDAAARGGTVRVFTDRLTPLTAWLTKTVPAAVKFIPAAAAPAADEPPVGLLVLDGPYTAHATVKALETWGPRAERYVVLLATETYGEYGEDGGPGVMPGLRLFLQRHPEWTVVNHDEGGGGLTVISADTRDRPALPSKIKMLANYTKAQVKWRAAGRPLVDQPTAEKRLALCMICPKRADDRCSKCGCYLEKIPDDVPVAGGGPGKVWVATELCPIGRWHQAPAAPEGGAEGTAT